MHRYVDLTSLATPQVAIRLVLFPYLDGRISLRLSSSRPGKIDEPSFDVRPGELDANPISDVKTFKPF